MGIALGGSILWALRDLSEISFKLVSAVVVILLVFIARMVSLYFARKREIAEDEKWNCAPYNHAAEGTIDNSSFVNEARAYRQTQKTQNRNREFGDTLTILAICAAGIVAYLQWQTLEKTDNTLRAGERAFVFVKQHSDAWTAAKKVGDEVVRSFVLEVENNGNTQTKDLMISLYCPRPNIFEKIDPITSGKKPDIVSPRLLGPKQTGWAGVCNYRASELEDVRAEFSRSFHCPRCGL